MAHRWQSGCWSRCLPSIPGLTRYTLLRVVMPMAELNYSSAAAAYTGLRETLKQLQELDQAESNGCTRISNISHRTVAQDHLPCNMRVIMNDRPATAILDEASAHRDDLIALATRGRGGLKRFVLGSVADKVLRADRAVLVYRPVDACPYETMTDAVRPDHVSRDWLTVTLK